MSDDNAATKLLASFGAMALFFSMLPFAIIAGPAFGALGGWCAGHIFVATFARLSALTGFEPYQMGAVGGFFGAFIRAPAQPRTSSK